MGENFRAGVLLTAFAGLWLAEVCGLRVVDVDFIAGRVAPAVPGRAAEDGDEPDAGPDPTNLALTLSAHVAEFSTDWVMCDPWGKQMGWWQLYRGFRRARGAVVSLPECFRFHDLRHYDASCSSPLAST
jgi:hypothetical protein